MKRMLLPISRLAIALAMFEMAVAGPLVRSGLISQLHPLCSSEAGSCSCCKAGPGSDCCQGRILEGPDHRSGGETSDRSHTLPYSPCHRGCPACPGSSLALIPQIAVVAVQLDLLGTLIPEADMPRGESAKGIFHPPRA